MSRFHSVECTGGPGFSSPSALQDPSLGTLAPPSSPTFSHSLTHYRPLSPTTNFSPTTTPPRKVMALSDACQRAPLPGAEGDRDGNFVNPMMRAGLSPQALQVRAFLLFGVFFCAFFFVPFSGAFLLHHSTPFPPFFPHFPSLTPLAKPPRPIYTHTKTTQHTTAHSSQPRSTTSSADWQRQRGARPERPERPASRPARPRPSRPPPLASSGAASWMECSPRSRPHRLARCSTAGASTSRSSGCELLVLAPSLGLCSPSLLLLLCNTLISYLLPHPSFPQHPALPPSLPPSSAPPSDSKRPSAQPTKTQSAAPHTAAAAAVQTRFRATRPCRPPCPAAIATRADRPCTAAASTCSTRRRRRAGPSRTTMSKGARLLRCSFFLFETIV